MIVFAGVAAAAQPGVALEEGEPIVRPCLDEPACAAFWGPQLSETMIEIGYTLHHEPVLTTALGAGGAGVVVEVGLESVPLGDRDVLQELYPVVPGVPALAAGYQTGGRDADAPSGAVGLHVVPPLKLGGGKAWAVGGTASFAVPIGHGLSLGGEGEYARSGVDVRLLPDTDTLADIPLLDPYFGRRGPECVEPCLDEFRQDAGAIRVGASYEPLQALFLYARGGVAVLAQRLELSIDGSVWGWSPVLPELSAGLGGRAGEVWQLSFGAVTAFRPASATTGSRSMTRLVLATGFRFGAAKGPSRGEAGGR